MDRDGMYNALCWLAKYCDLEMEELINTKFAMKWDTAKRALTEAIKIIKAQEPVKPEFVKHIEPDLSYWACGACGAFVWGNAMDSDVIKVIYRPNYCQHCGREVRWE